MNQFDRLGDIGYPHLNRYRESFKEFVESTLGYPVPVKNVGDSVGWLGGWESNSDDDYKDRMFAVRVINQDMADLLNYLADEDKAIVGTAMLVLIPGGCEDYTVPADLQIVMLTKDEWEDRIGEETRLRNIRITKHKSTLTKSLTEVQGDPDFTPFKDEETV